MSSSPPVVDQVLVQAYLHEFPYEAAKVLESVKPAEVAALLEAETPEKAANILNLLTPESAALAMERMSEEVTVRALQVLEPQRVSTLLTRLPRELREAQLSAMDPDLAGELRSLMEYPPDSAGSLMDPRVLAFRPDTTVSEVLNKLRSLRRRRIQDVFAVDPEGKLVGSLPLQQVALADPRDTLSRLMSQAPPSIQATSSRDAVMESLEEHRASSLPVVDFAGRLVGVLRQEGLIAATQQSVSANLAKMVGASKDERALSSPLFAVRKRLPWLEVNLLTAFLAAAVVGIFEGTIARFTALAVLLPVVAGQSGNTGAQALAVTMRGLALREIRTRHWSRVATKELLAGFLNGCAVAVTTSLAVFIWSRSMGLALVIGISMILSMTAAGLAGAVIPMILTALHQDPAQSSSIVLTTVTDVAGFFSFLGIATLLMGIL